MGIKYKIDAPLDSPERTIIHRQIIQKKYFLKKLYLEWYGNFVKELDNLPEGILLELGSGGGFLKEIIPSVVCSDVISLPSNDMTFSALKMPFKNNSVSGIFMVDTFHHIPDSEIFLKEAARVLKKNGKIIMVEPANSLWGRFIFKNFHHEPFDPKGTWKIPDAGPMSGANGSLPWIVFERDKEIFYKKFPGFKINSIKYHHALTYLVSGGVSRRQLMPDFTYPLFSFMDKFHSFISKQFSMFMTVKISAK
jgi:SAM-dependent methyltransferase